MKKVILLGMMLGGLLIAGSIVFMHDVLRLEKHFLQQGSGPGVVLVCMGRGDCGMERCALLQQQAFIDAGIDSVLVCHRKGWIAQQALARKLPVVLCANTGVCSQTFSWIPGVQHAIKQLSKHFGDRLLAAHCNMPREAFAAKRALDGSNIPVIFSQHTPNLVSATLRKTVDGFVGISRHVAQKFADLNKQEGIVCPLIELAPYFDYERFLGVQPTKSRQAFFKDAFNIDNLKPIPLLLKIANFYVDVKHKNHPLMIQALHEIIYRRGIPVQLALVGSGNDKAVRALVHELKLDDYVHFLGATNLTPELFYYADCCVLSSSKEAGGIVILEGGLMKKPTIVARGTGAADWWITDNETGFLFDNDDYHSLADTIAYVLAQPTEAAACGERLHERVMTNFIPPQTVATNIAFYRHVAAIKNKNFLHRA